MKQIRAASMRPSSFNENDNTIEVVWTTGASVRRYDHRRGVTFDEVLSVAPGHVRLDRLNAGAPLLDAHDDRRLAAVIGSVVPGSARIEGGVGIACVKLSSAAADADLVQKIRDGIIRSISVGYAIHRWQIAPGDNGADETRTAVDWEPLELSAVPVPADAGAQFRGFDRDDSPEAARARMFERQIAAGLSVEPPVDSWRCLWTIPIEERT